MSEAEAHEHLRRIFWTDEARTVSDETLRSLRRQGLVKTTGTRLDLTPAGRRIMLAVPPKENDHA